MRYDHDCTQFWRSVSAFGHGNLILNKLPRPTRVRSRPPQWHSLISLITTLLLSQLDSLTKIREIYFSVYALIFIQIIFISMHNALSTVWKITRKRDHAQKFRQINSLLTSLVKCWFDGKNVDFCAKIVIAFYNSFPHCAKEILVSKDLTIVY